MTIYLDSEYRCHLTNDGTRRPVETDAFNGKCAAYIEGYRYIPDGESWTRSDGAVFNGLMVAPAKAYDRIMVDVAIGYLDDDEAESVTMLFEDWQTGVAYAVGDRRKYEGLLYRCVQAHTSQADWTPPAVPALWVRTSTEEWPEWIQPTGAHDAYNTGDKVSHNDKHWISIMDANVYEPGVFGWDEA